MNAPVSLFSSFSFELSTISYTVVDGDEQQVNCVQTVTESMKQMDNMLLEISELRALRTSRDLLSSTSLYANLCFETFFLIVQCDIKTKQFLIFLGEQRSHDHERIQFLFQFQNKGFIAVWKTKNTL